MQNHAQHLLVPVLPELCDDGLAIKKALSRPVMRREWRLTERGAEVLRACSFFRMRFGIHYVPPMSGLSDELCQGWSIKPETNGDEWVAGSIEPTEGQFVLIETFERPDHVKSGHDDPFSYFLSELRSSGNIRSVPGENGSALQRFGFSRLELFLFHYSTFAMMLKEVSSLVKVRLPKLLELYHLANVFPEYSHFVKNSTAEFYNDERYGDVLYGEGTLVKCVPTDEPVPHASFRLVAELDAEPV